VNRDVATLSAHDGGRLAQTRVSCCMTTSGLWQFDWSGWDCSAFELVTYPQADHMGAQDLSRQHMQQRRPSPTRWDGCGKEPDRIAVQLAGTLRKVTK